MTDSKNTKVIPSERKANPWRKILLELGPLMIFFAAFKFGGIFVATGAFMVAMPIAMAAAWHFERHIPVMQKVTFVIVMVMGSLTLYLENATFVYMKPTIINGLFATILTVGLLRGRSYLKVVMEAGFPQLEDKGWMVMTRNWALFFTTMALTNEFVWRIYGEDIWVNFKTFGFLPLTLIFAFAQTPIIMKYQIHEEENSDG
jgi:intracellular septation protein